MGASRDAALWTLAATAGWSLGAEYAPSWGIGGGNGRERKTAGLPGSGASDCFSIVKLHRTLPRGASDKEHSRPVP